MGGFGLCVWPVAAGLWIREMLEEVPDGAAVVGEWGHFALYRRSKQGRMSGKLRMRQTSAQMMDAMERFVKQRQGQ